MRHLARRLGLTAVLALLTTTLLAFGTAAPASAAACVPVNGQIGDVRYDVCATATTLQPGFPGAGQYVALNGYVTACVGTLCTTLPFDGGQTGVAYNTNDSKVTTTPGGTVIPNVCVASVCTPGTLPGATVQIFTDSRTLTLRALGNEVGPNPPGVCVSSTGSCVGGSFGLTD